MAYFGYPAADEDDAERALLAGLEILETLTEISAGEEQPLQVRVGVARGQAVVGNFPGAPAGVSSAAFRSVVTLAERLQTLAPPTQILPAYANSPSDTEPFQCLDFGHPQFK